MILVIASFALGDGRFFRLTELERPTEIPTQRAFLRQGKGQVTMIVESVLNAEKGDYGWIVPVPATPLYVNSVKPDYMRQAFEKYRPRIRIVPPESYITNAFLILWGLAMITAGFRYRKSTPVRRLFSIFAEALLFLAIPFILPLVTGNTAVKKGSAIGQVSKSLGEYGAYKVFVLDETNSADRSGAVMNWLSKNGFKYSKAEAAVIQSYSDQKWKFVVAKFRHDVNGTFPPHPLKIVYPGNKLVYPMRLTGQTTKSLFLELLVVGNESVAVPGMKALMSNISEWKVNVFDELGVRNDQYKAWNHISIEGAKFGEVTTYLRGELAPKQMQDDMVLAPTKYEYLSEQLTPSSMIPLLVMTDFGNTSFVVGCVFALIAIWSTEFSGLGLVFLLVVGGARAGVLVNTINIVDINTLVTEDRYQNRQVRQAQQRRTEERLEQSGKR